MVRPSVDAPISTASSLYRNEVWLGHGRGYARMQAKLIALAEECFPHTKSHQILYVTCFAHYHNMLAYGIRHLYRWWGTSGYPPTYFLSPLPLESYHLVINDIIVKHMKNAWERYGSIGKPEGAHYPPTPTPCGICYPPLNWCTKMTVYICDNST